MSKENQPIQKEVKIPRWQRLLWDVAKVAFVSSIGMFLIETGQAMSIGEIDSDLQSLNLTEAAQVQEVIDESRHESDSDFVIIIAVGAVGAGAATALWLAKEHGMETPKDIEPATKGD